MVADKFSYTFSGLVFGGRIKAAQRLLANHENNGDSTPLPNAKIDDDGSALDVLKNKHPAGKTPLLDVLLTNDNTDDT